MTSDALSTRQAASAARYAVYFAPSIDSPWWRFGAGWLGWDERRSVVLRQPVLKELSQERLHALTAEPRRYGFHATLKAPFRLQPTTDEDLLRGRIQALARELRRVPLGPMEPRSMDNFVALVPAQRQPEIDALAMHCVTELDDLRAPLTAVELERRKPHLLDARARAFLQCFGYPWVLDLFRFHMTLSGPVDPATAKCLVMHAREAVAALNASHPLAVDRLCVFREDHPGAPFLRIMDQELPA